MPGVTVGMARRDPFAGIISALGLEPEDNLGQIAISFLFHFFVLASYYIVQPLRDELSTVDGIENVPILFNASFVVMLVINTLLANSLATVPVDRLVPVIYRIFVASLVFFYVALSQFGPKFPLPQLFFLWSGVYNLLCISLFWMAMAANFRYRTAARSFGVIGAGGTLGQVVGSAITSGLVRTFGSVPLLLASAVLLELAVRCCGNLDIAWLTSQGASSQQSPSSNAPGSQAGGQAPQGGTFRSLLSGIHAMVRTPVLRHLCAHVFLFTCTGSFLYFRKQELIIELIPSDIRRTTFRADLNGSVGFASFIIQLLGTGRIVPSIGTSAALSIVPCVTALGFAALALRPTVAVLSVVMLSRKVAGFALDKAARETLFTMLGTEERTVAKSLIDTFVYRCGDAFAASVFGIALALDRYDIHLEDDAGGTGAHKGVKLGAMILSLVSLLATVLWVLNGIFLGRIHATYGRPRLPSADREMQPVGDKPAQPLTSSGSGQPLLAVSSSGLNLSDKGSVSTSGSEMNLRGLHSDAQRSLRATRVASSDALIA